MTTTDVTAKVGRGDEADKVSTSYDFGEDLADATKKFSEAIVFAHWRASVTIGLQNYMRALLKAGKTAEEIIKAVKEEWKPGVRVPAQSPVEKAESLFNSLSTEQQDALIKRAQTKKK